MTASRSQFAKLAALTAVIGFTVGGILSPPDPFSQLRMTGLVIGLGFVGSYWLVYKSTVDLPSLRWGDLFRWYVSTHLFVLLIILVTNLDSPFAFGSLASRLLQLGIFVIGAGLARIVVFSDRIPWPGDR